MDIKVGYDVTIAGKVVGITAEGSYYVRTKKGNLYIVQDEDIKTFRPMEEGKK